MLLEEFPPEAHFGPAPTLRGTPPLPQGTLNSWDGPVLSHERWDGLGDTTEPRLARMERWFLCVEAVCLHQLLSSPVELIDDYSILLTNVCVSFSRDFGVLSEGGSGA